MTWRKSGGLAAAILLACGGGGGGGRLPTPDAGAALGVAYDAGTGAATFRVWAPSSSSARVLLFDSWSATSPSASYPMDRELDAPGDLDKNGWDGIWTATVPSLASGQLYQYDVGFGLALDPYAPSMGRFDSSTMSSGKGAALDPSSIGPEDLLTGEPTATVPFDAPPGYGKREDAVIYEVHVRDLTIFLSGLAHPVGTYEAFAEALDHVAKLGATHVELLPVLAYTNGDEGKRATVELDRTTTGNNYNWGYDPQSWFAPDGMYSEDPEDPARRVRELKTLVNEAHRRGLGVILDVVYNHTGSTAVLDALVPGYYYRGTNYSGVGNDTASERKMMRKLVVDSVRYLVEQYGVDGFRFDLMGLLDSVTMEEAYQAAAAVKPAVLFIGEGWRMGGVPSTDYAGTPIVAADQGWMASPDAVGISAFSDSYRNVMKGGGLSETSDTDAGFLTGADPAAATLLRNLSADPTNFTADGPGDPVQYLTAHDGLTLHDKIGKILRLDPTRAAQEATIMQVVRLGFALQATSQGMLFLQGGCEMGRSKWVPAAAAEATSANGGGRYYVYNSYDSSDAVNGFDWATPGAPGSVEGQTAGYVQGLLALRASTDAFRLGSKAQVTANLSLLDGSRAGAIAFQAVSSDGATAYAVFANAGTGAVALSTGGLDLRGADVLVDAGQAGTSPIAPVDQVGFSVAEAAVTVEPRTAVVIRRSLP
ncbi:MAG TPA: alpha-amylase family glycosyl hydrolase [Anaeromyxobacter sp.]|nr:alpha-amylase family glycosyl hydrolase [Anaeromyxobacter sp.]